MSAKILNFDKLYENNGFILADEDIQADILLDANIDNNIEIYQALIPKYIEYLNILKTTNSSFGNFLKQYKFDFAAVHDVLMAGLHLPKDHKEKSLYVKTSMLFIYTYIPYYYYHFVLSNKNNIDNSIRHSQFTKSVKCTYIEETVSNEILKLKIFGKEEHEYIINTLKMEDDYTTKVEIHNLQICEILKKAKEYNLRLKIFVKPLHYNTQIIKQLKFNIEPIECNNYLEAFLLFDFIHSSKMFDIVSVEVGRQINKDCSVENNGFLPSHAVLRGYLNKYDLTQIIIAGIGKSEGDKTFIQIKNTQLNNIKKNKINVIRIKKEEQNNDKQSDNFNSFVKFNSNVNEHYEQRERHDKYEAPEIVFNLDINDGHDGHDNHEFQQLHPKLQECIEEQAKLDKMRVGKTKHKDVVYVSVEERNNQIKKCKKLWREWKKIKNEKFKN